MINRANWKLYKAYLRYRVEVAQISENSLRMNETRLRHLLKWADSTPFVKVPSIRPTFPKYLKNARADGRGSKLSPAYTKKVIEAAYQFGTWLIIYHSGYKNKFPLWVDSLRPPRSFMFEQQRKKAITLQEVRAIAAAPVHEVWEQRIKSAVILMYLSGIRVGAFVTLPLKAVNIPELEIKQWGDLGVKTKNRKEGTTFLFDIPDLIQIVQDWDNKVRAILDDSGYWFAPLDSLTGEINTHAYDIGENRDMRVRVDLKRWLSSVGLPYYSPHKFRHGFTLYGRNHSKDPSDFKAVSENLMHSSVYITDSLYGSPSEQDVKERIRAMGQLETQSSNNKLDTISEIEALLAKLKAQQQ